MINRVRRQPAEVKPENLKIVRSREYKGSRIVRMENGEQYVILKEGGFVKTDGLEDGMSIIDKSLEAKSEPTSRRPLRTSHNIIKEPEGPFGGMMKNPPTTCESKKQDKEGFWVDCVICAYYCKVNINCKVWLKIKEGSKERIRNVGR